MMQTLSLTSGASAVPSIAGYGTRAWPGLVVRVETVGWRQPGTRWRLRRGCGSTFEVYDSRGAYLGQLVAPSEPQAPEFGGDTVYLDRTHLSVLRS